MATVMITGATSGIGLALAQIYRKRGDRLLLVGRRPLTDLQDGLFSPETYIQADLAGENAANIVSEALTNMNVSQLDVLIHNAGLGYFGITEAQPVENIEALVAVNLRAPVALTHALLPHLKAARGKLVFISSVASAMPVPDYNVYGATKAALDAFAYNLRIELRDDVTVQLIHPGATRTDMHRKAGITADDMDTSKFTPAETVAEKIVAAVDKGSKQASIGASTAPLRWAGKHAARLIDTAMKGRS